MLLRGSIQLSICSELRGLWAGCSTTVVCNLNRNACPDSGRARTAQLSLLTQLKPCIPGLVGLWRF